MGLAGWIGGRLGILRGSWIRGEGVRVTVALGLVDGGRWAMSS